jgi:hypothetical protein
MDRIKRSALARSFIGGAARAAILANPESGFNDADAHCDEVCARVACSQ